MLEQERGAGQGSLSVEGEPDAASPAVVGRRRTVLSGVRTHNLKGIDVAFPHRALTVVSGVSGSGKSSLAFDTLYAEGQRRFVESLSTYARQFLARMERPPVDHVRDIQPAVALQQKNSVKNARSTVATLTELSDHLQLIFTHIGVTRCPECGAVVQRESAATVVERLREEPEGSRLIFVAEVAVLDIETPQQVLDELVAEGYRRLFVDGAVVALGEGDVEGLLSRRSFPVVVDRLVLKAESDSLRLREAIEHAFRLGRDRMQVFVLDGAGEGGGARALAFDKAFRCNTCRTALIEPFPQLFSFNSPVGACEACSGFGRVAGLDWDKVVPNPRLSLQQGAIAVFESEGKATQRRALLQKAQKQGIPLDVPFGRLPAEQRRWLLEGGKGFKGIKGFFEGLEEKRYKPQARILIARYRGYTPCPTCEGTRLSRSARAVTVDGLRISAYLAMTVAEARECFDALGGRLDPRALARIEPLLYEIQTRLRYLCDVGVTYLRLDRASRTLSGGEVQRIHLTSSLGRMLTDTLYVLDEPTAGLHPRDSERLISVLRALRDVGNTVVVVEHDPEVIDAADWVIELGPEGGERGGALLFEGDVRALYGASTPTGDAMRQRHLLELAAASQAAPPNDWISVQGARENNLRDLTVRFPLGRFTAVTGVSGSGKSTLVHRCFFENWRRLQGEGGVEAGTIDELAGLGSVREVVLMGQGGMGRSKRSTVASYTKAWDGVRTLFGGSRAAAKLGIGPGHFSFNTPGGRCERCEGTGTVLIEMHFMADLEIVCEECEGRRFTEKTLSVRYRDRSIHDILQMTVDEAITFFEKGAVRNRLAPLVEVGLGYLRMGQTTNTLSGGEAQRLMLASYVGRGTASPGAGVVFIFDEPTIGLHLKDVQVLVRALRKVVAAGHTVIAVEHNTDFIAQADWVIDLGPDGGDGGGALVVEGTPLDVARCEASHTGRFLRELLRSR